MLIDNIISNAQVVNQEYRLFLCKMNGDIVREITKQSYSKIYSPILGGVDSFSFSIPKKYDNIDVLNYDDIVGKNLIKVQVKDTPIAYFEIQNIETSFDGLSEIKNVKCYSSECKLINKHIYLTEGTFKLVNNTDPSKGILNMVVSKAKSWSIGYIDNVLISKERYFDIADTNVLELLTDSVQKTFDCMFVYDTVNKTINAYSLQNFGTTSPVIVSMSNLINSANVTEISEEIVTRLHLYGDNEVSVRDVNFGNDYIDNFNYYKSDRFMSTDLMNALNNYESTVNSSRQTYTNYLTTLSTLEASLVTKNSELLVLQEELNTLNKTKSYLQSIGESTTVIQQQINAKQTQITTKQNEISTLNGQITSTNTNINTLIASSSMENHFTSTQLKELDQFIIEDTYQDSSFLVTDEDTYNQKIIVEKNLLQAGATILSRVSVPRYKIDIDSVDFLKNKEFSYWWDKIAVGDIMRVDVDGRFVVNVRLVGYEHNWDDNSLKLNFGDKYQFDDANIQLMDLIKNSISTGISVDYERFKYKEYSGNKTEVLDFINSSIDLAKNNVVGGNNQEILFDDTGLLLRRYDPNLGRLSGNQIKLTNNAIVITDDSFNTAKTAIGKLANGLYGIAAEVVAGKMILGNNMIIETGSGDFRVDGNGVNITKMALNMTSSDGLKNIQLDPNIGFKIRTRPNVSSGFSDKFYVDSSGNLQFSGNLNGASGTFSGSLSGASISGGTITGTSISGGSLNIGSRFSVNTSGDLFASNASISGNISGSNISGSNINGGSIRIGSGSYYVDILDGSIYFTSSSSQTQVIGMGGGVEVRGNLNANNLFGNYLSCNSGYLSNTTIQNGYGYFNDLYINGESVATINDIVRYNPVQGGGGQDIKLQVYGGNLEVFLYGSVVGTIPLV